MLKLDVVVLYVWLFCCVTSSVFALRGTAVVLNARAKAAADLTSTASPNATPDNGNPDEEGGEGLPPVENSTKPILTGIPQIDYVHDPNLPRELNGYNLSSYPFFNKVPSDITFKCDGLHDGFYASVPHKCQLYHHCLFGTRYDFLCANYTAFDQKSFICHYVSEVDCDNSAKYFKRNDALYKAAETTTIATTTTTTTTTPAPTTQRDTYRDRDRERDRDRDYRDRDRDDYRDRDRDRDTDRDRDRDVDRDRIRDRDYRDRDRDRDYRDRDRMRNRDRDYRDRDYRDRMRDRPRDNHRKRKPLKRRRPVYEYYYDDVYADEEYEDELPLPPPVKKSRKVLESVKPVSKSGERDYIKPIDRDYVKPSGRGYDKPSDRDYIKPIERDYIKPVERDYVKPSDRDYAKPIERDSIKPSDRGYAKSIERDYAKPADRDYIKPIEKNTTPSSFRNRGKSKYEEDPRESRKPVAASAPSEEYDDEYYEDEEEPRQPSQSQQGAKTVQVIPASPLSVFSRPRVPPRINRPVPLNEKSKYEYVKST